MEFKINATVNKVGKYYEHFGIRESLVSLYGNKPEDIIELKMKISEDQTLPPNNDKCMNPDYWGWFNNDRKEFTMIYAKRFLLEICFPYGIKACEDQNEEKAYRLTII